LKTSLISDSTPRQSETADNNIGHGNTIEDELADLNLNSMTSLVYEDLIFIDTLQKNKNSLSKKPSIIDTDRRSFNKFTSLTSVETLSDDPLQTQRTDMPSRENIKGNFLELRS